jgi:excisionase family DNA binding protein
MVCESELLTRNEAARYLGIKPGTLACWVSTRRYALAFVRVGSRVRYRRSDLDAWLQSRTIGAAAE